MNLEKFSCEENCHNQDLKISSTQLIAITGGPGAGKTTLLEVVRKTLCHHTVIVPEAASILYGGGFWRLDSAPATKSAQRAIFKVQTEMQKIVLNEKKWNLALCDRGTIDGLAYWPDSEENFFTENQAILNTEYANYSAVIHLRSPGEQQGYNHQNPIRTESPEQAHQLDRKIEYIWKNHPHYFQIPSTDHFLDKINQSVAIIKKFIDPQCLKNLS